MKDAMEGHEQAVAEFNRALWAMHEEAQKRRFGDVAAVIQGWIDELRNHASEDAICCFAKRAARHIGGMGGITDGVPRTPSNQSYFESVDRLYRAAENLAALCGRG